MSALPSHALRDRAAVLLEAGGQGLGRAIDLFLIGLISLNVVAIIIESVPEIGSVYRAEFQRFEIVSVVLFSIEYLARLWVAPSLGDARFVRPILGRLRYALTPAAVVDLLAILPFYLSFLVTIDLRFLRVVRLVRIFKLTRYSAAMNMILSVLREESSAFVGSFFILLVLLILTSSGIYLIEHTAQPEAFGSIPAAMWWALVTLTTVGYGDVTPQTGWGKVFGGMITVIGIGMVALPAGILASGFSDQMRRRRESFNEKIASALEDGMLSSAEQDELETLREQIGIAEEDAEQIYRIMARRAELADFCPHCGGALIGSDRSAQES
jgi:voltage-gated potassium channel